jgi:hypothetical protein
MIDDNETGRIRLFNSTRKRKSINQKNDFIGKKDYASLKGGSLSHSFGRTAGLSALAIRHTCHVGLKQLLRSLPRCGLIDSMHFFFEAVIPRLLQPYGK